MSNNIGKTKEGSFKQKDYKKTYTSYTLKSKRPFYGLSKYIQSKPAFMFLKKFIFVNKTSLKLLCLLGFGYYVYYLLVCYCKQY